MWCVPVPSSRTAETSLPLHELTHRILAYPKGIVPPTATMLTCGIDLGKYLAHWVMVAWSEGATGHVVDYGRLEIASTDLGVEKAILFALREFQEQMKEGFPVHDSPGKRLPLQLIWIDAGYMTDVVYNFVKEHPGRCILPAVGRGAAQQRTQWYNRPTSTGSVVRHIGEGFHINLLASPPIFLAEVDADHWKSWVHQRLVTPLGQPGAMTLYAARPSEHLSFCQASHGGNEDRGICGWQGLGDQMGNTSAKTITGLMLCITPVLSDITAASDYCRRFNRRVPDPPREPPRQIFPFINLDGWRFSTRNY